MHRSKGADGSAGLSSLKGSGPGLIPPGLLMLVCLGLSIAALAARDFRSVLGLAAAEICLALLLRLGPRFYKGMLRFLLLQSLVIGGLYILRFGFAEGLGPGLRVSCQIALALAPGTMMLQSLPHSRMMRSLNRIMPMRAAFVLATSLRFLPMLRRELKTIHQAQILRGARLAPSALWRPGNWPDWISCLLVPFIVQVFKMAGEIAMAATIRGFETSGCRTFWPGDGGPGGGNGG
jgi:energy-coupling factor transport system permease protein